jgi:hypothetical protein
MQLALVIRRQQKFTQELIKNGLLVTGGMQVFTHPRQTRHTKPSSESRRIAELCRSSRARANVLNPCVNVVAPWQQAATVAVFWQALVLQGLRFAHKDVHFWYCNAVVG